jgi:hypothetical protein
VGNRRRSDEHAFHGMAVCTKRSIKFSKRCNADRIVRCVRVTLENSTCHLQKSYCEFEKVLIKRQIIGDILNMPLA